MSWFLSELRRRKILQWAVAYVAGGWVLLEIVAFLTDMFGWPTVFIRSLTILVAVGFLATLVVAWYHGERGGQRVQGVEVLMLAALFVAAGSLVALVNAPAGDTEAAERAAADSPGASIAVLPFLPMSGDPEDEYFGDGLTEELINALSRVEGVRVAARTSSFAFKGEERPVQEIGRLLNVSHVLEGSVRRGANDELRIAAQLIDTDDGFHRWSRTWDRAVEDVFEIQEEISRAIVTELRMQIGPGQAVVPLADAGTRSFDAYDLYLRGVAGLNQASETSLDRAADLFEAALEEDPDFAPAFVGIAHARIRQGIFYVQPDSVLPMAMVAANRAIALDSTLAAAYVAKAFINTEYEWDWEEADRLFQKALELAPGDAGAHQWYQNLLRILGRCDEAAEHGEVSARLDPLSAVLIHDLGYTYYYCRDFGRAVRRLREALALDPEPPILRMRYGMALSKLGRYQEAIEAGLAAVELADREPVTVAALARTLADAGREAEARELIAEVEEAAATQYVDGVYASAAYTALGDHDTAIRWIQRAYDERSPSLVSIKVHPWHDPLRADSRFQEILEQMGLVDPAS